MNCMNIGMTRAKAVFVAAPDAAELKKQQVPKAERSKRVKKNLLDKRDETVHMVNSQKVIYRKKYTGANPKKPKTAR